MIDNFAVLLTEGLMLIATWRLLKRPDLDDEGGESKGRWPKGRWPRA